MSAHPELIYIVNDQMFRQIRIHHKIVIGIRGGDKLPPPYWQQIVVLLHQAPHFLDAYLIAFPLHQYGDAAVSIKSDV